MTVETDAWTLLVVAGLTAMSVVSRTLFFWSSRPWSMPGWLQRGLVYAPIAALAAVIVPELVLTDGHLLPHLLDARLFGFAAGSAWYFRHQGKNHAVLGTILSGMVVYLPLHLGLGW